MKFSNILFAVFGLSAFAAALPAPAPAAGAGIEVFEKRDMVERTPSLDLANRGAPVNFVGDVQVCIDAVVAINKKYSGKKPYTSGTCKSWAAEVVVQIKLLISIISGYPADCTYPSIDVCVSILVKLFVAIFVQLKVFIDVGGLLAFILITVDILLAFLLGLVADLLNIVVSLCLLLELKLKVGITALILNGCGGLIDGLYIKVLIKLLVKAGISL